MALARTQASSVVNDSMSLLRSPLGGEGSTASSIPASASICSSSRLTAGPMGSTEASSPQGAGKSGRSASRREDRSSQALGIASERKTMTPLLTSILRAERVRSIRGERRRRAMDDKNRSKALELAIAGVEKEFGKGAIMRLKEGESLHEEIPVVPTGSVGLDLALGIGGYPRGRIVEIYGPESSGKTTLTLHAIANVKKVGVKTEELLISQPDYGEQALEIADMLVRSNAVDLVVVDSVAALVPKAEIQGDMGDRHVGTQARLM